MIKNVMKFWKKEPIFSVAMILALGTSLFTLPSAEAIDWKVIALLLNLMLVIAALETYQFLDRLCYWFIARFATRRSLALALVGLTAVAAMLITNDVALLAIVPITIMISKKCGFNPAWLIICQTLAANLGSSFTPMGNPQNLFLYEYYQIGVIEFFAIMLPIILLGLGFTLVLTCREKKESIQWNGDQKFAPLDNRQKGYLFLFLLVVGSVFRLLDYVFVLLVTLIVVAVDNRKLFAKVDYYLLGTFVAFFVAIDNLTELLPITEMVANILSQQGATLLSGAIVSQGISNVPAAILLANFTGNYQELLWGVNIGGLGTLIASLASVISYRIYAREYPKERYLAQFHVVNLLGLVILLGIAWILIWM